MTSSLRTFLQRLDNLKIEVSTNKTSTTSDLRNKLSMIMRQGFASETCQSFLEKISQATTDFQEFTKTDKLVRVPSIEQPNQTSLMKSVQSQDLTVSEIVAEGEMSLLAFNDDEEKDYEGFFRDVSPIASSLSEHENTFSRDCYYFEEQEEQEEHSETVIISENVDTFSMASSHIDLVEVDKETCNDKSSEDGDMSTNLSIEFDIEINAIQDNTFEEDGMILKLLEREEENMKKILTTLDLGSNVDLNDK